METNRIRQFLVVCQTGNLRKAADLLHISHSGLAKSLRVLEDELGGPPLFVRDGRRIVPSDFGRRLAQRAPDFLKTCERFVDEPAAEAALPELRIATFEVFSTHFLGELAHKLRGRPLVARELLPGAIERDVAEGRADYGITYEPVPVQGVDFLRLGRIRMGLFGLRRAFAAQPFAQLPFCAPALPIVGAPTGVRGLDGWPDDKCPRHVLYRVDLMETALELCRQGLAVAFLPEFVARLHNRKMRAEVRLEELPVPPTVNDHRSVYLVKRTATSEGADAKLLAKSIRLACRESDT